MSPADVLIHVTWEGELPTYLPTYLPIYLPTYLPIYLPTYLPTHLPTLLPTYLPGGQAPPPLARLTTKHHHRECQSPRVGSGQNEGF